MISVIALLVILALVAVLGAAVGRWPLWIAVLLLVLVHLFTLLPVR